MIVIQQRNDKFRAARGVCAALALLMSLPIFAGGYGGSTGAPLGQFAPGFSQNCIDRLDPKLSGAAANRAVRACRRPTGPQAGDWTVARVVKATVSEPPKP